MTRHGWWKGHFFTQMSDFHCQGGLHLISFILNVAISSCKGFYLDDGGDILYKNSIEPVASTFIVYITAFFISCTKYIILISGVC